MPEGYSLYLWKSGPRILTELVFLSSSYILVRVSIIETVSKSGGVRNNSPLLHYQA